MKIFLKYVLQDSFNIHVLVVLITTSLLKYKATTYLKQVRTLINKFTNKI
jgi:hypothetical protein